MPFLYRHMHRHGIVWLRCANKLFSSPILRVAGSHPPESPKRGNENESSPPTLTVAPVLAALREAPPPLAYLRVASLSSTEQSIMRALRRVGNNLGGGGGSEEATQRFDTPRAAHVPRVVAHDEGHGRCRSHTTIRQVLRCF